MHLNMGSLPYVVHNIFYPYERGYDTTYNSSLSAPESQRPVPVDDVLMTEFTAYRSVCQANFAQLVVVVNLQPLAQRPAQHERTSAHLTTLPRSIPYFYSKLGESHISHALAYFFVPTYSWLKHSRESPIPLGPGFPFVQE